MASRSHRLIEKVHEHAMSLLGKLQVHHYCLQGIAQVLERVWYKLVLMHTRREQTELCSEGTDTYSSWLHCRSLACESLKLLQTALPCVPRQLLAEEVWGSIIGMFELNNLAVQVQSPVELFFLAVDDLPEEQQEEVQAITQPWLDALDTDYDVCGLGTALYALQSCMNHSSNPNAATTKEDCDMDGKAVISAQQDIREGDEVLISYVDLSAPESEQKSALRDYGIEL